MNTLVVLFAVAVAVLVVADANRGPGGRGPPPSKNGTDESRPGPPRGGPFKGLFSGKKPGGGKAGRSFPPGDKYNWTREVGNNETIKESAFIPNNTKTVEVISDRKNKNANNITGAIVVYDFSNTTSVVIIAPKDSSAPCILTSTDKTFDTVLADVKAKNGTKVPEGVTETITATGPILTANEAKTARETHKSLNKFYCRNRNITQAVASSPDAQLPAGSTTKTITVSNGYNKVAITYVPQPQKKSFPRGPGGPKGGPGGHRGGPGGPKPQRKH